ncbi:MAG: hypothetical protein HZB51_00595 [Chloroflexi bacterium]|nr:hypothetical protein [Chloroflexota bacterium]
MSKKVSAKKRVPPAAFGEHRHAAFERTVQLTQKAIAQLQTQGQKVTLSALSKATQAFDEKGKGLEPNTILRNPESAKLFREQSLAYQRRQERVRKAKRKHPQVKLDVQATYRGLRSVEFIAMIEDLKTQIVALKTQQARLQVERDEAHRLRDQALQQNMRQLARLTQSLSQIPLTEPSHAS